MVFSIELSRDLNSGNKEDFFKNYGLSFEKESTVIV